MRNRMLVFATLLIVALIVPSSALANPGPHFTVWPFWTVLHPELTQNSLYWTIPSGDSVQYAGDESDPDEAAFVVSGQSGSIRYVEMRLEPDINFDPWYSYNNAETSGVPTGYSQGSGNQLYCHSQGHPVWFASRVQWSENWATGSALGSTGVGLWNSPITAEGFLPAKVAFVQILTGLGPSLAVVNEEQSYINFVPLSLNTSAWNTLIMKVEDMGSFDRVRVYLWDRSESPLSASDMLSGSLTLLASVDTPAGVKLGCTSIELWVDNRAYDEFGQLFLLNPVETQYMRVDWVVAVQF